MVSTTRAVAHPPSKDHIKLQMTGASIRYLDTSFPSEKQIFTNEAVEDQTHKKKLYRWRKFFEPDPFYLTRCLDPPADTDPLFQYLLSNTERRAHEERFPDPSRLFQIQSLSPQPLWSRRGEWGEIRRKLRVVDEEPEDPWPEGFPTKPVSDTSSEEDSPLDEYLKGRWSVSADPRGDKVEAVIGYEPSTPLVEQRDRVCRYEDFITFYLHKMDEQMLIICESLLGKSIPPVRVKVKDGQVVYIVVNEVNVDVDSA